jgi:hypothetical protein
VTTVAAIVEGHGEVAAVPGLLRRLLRHYGPSGPLNLPTPIRVPRDRFLNREDEFRRHLLLAAAKCGEQGWILVLLDADDDCPAELGVSILQRARACVPHRRVSVVLANREYEAWFIAAAASLHGQRGFVFEPGQPVDAERGRDAKGWMAKRMAARSYDEIRDQAAFTAVMDLDQAHAGSRSFRKLCSEWRKQMVVPGGCDTLGTPADPSA